MELTVISILVWLIVMSLLVSALSEKRANRMLKLIALVFRLMPFTAIVEAVGKKQR